MTIIGIVFIFASYLVALASGMAIERDESKVVTLGVAITVAFAVIGELLTR